MIPEGNQNSNQNMQPKRSAGKHEINAKRGKTCKRCQATKSIQTLRSAGKVANVAKRDKAWKHCPARENMELMIRVGKRAEVNWFPQLVSPLLLIG